MNKLLFERTLKYKFLPRVKDLLIKKELKKRAGVFNRLRGHPIAVFGNDIIGINIITEGVYEKEHIKDLLLMLKSIGINLNESSAIDVGANIGNHSIQFSKHFEYVFSFEPNPRTFDLLNANTKQIDNIKVFNFGCGVKDQTATLSEIYENIGGSSAVMDIKADNLVEINIKPLDTIFNEITNLKLIKIDVEGMEIEVLKGAEKIISNFYPVICFEQHKNEFLKKFIETEVIDWLRAKGFKIYAIRPPKKRNFLFRRFKTIQNILFGITEKRQIIEYKKLPKGEYSMVYAIHTSTLN